MADHDAPYVYHAYPRMLYRATMDSPPPPVPTYMREINVVTDSRIIPATGHRRYGGPGGTGEE